MKKLICAWFCVLAFCSSAGAQDQQINIKDHLFAPSSVIIKTGTKVTWINKDADPHTVAEQSNAFRSSALDTNDSYSHIFAAPGTYKYFCTLHPTMIGSITVK